MYLKSMTVTDYSTGNSYSYSDMSGTWQSIVSNGGQINGNKGVEPSSVQSAPTVTETADDAPIPWSGTHMQTSTFVTPNVWPWVATDSPAASASPSHWQFRSQSSSGHVKPPGGGSVSEHSPAPSSTPLGLITKTGSSISQSTFPSTSLPSSSSAASSRSGIKSPPPSSIRLTPSSTLATTTTTTNSETTSAEVGTEVPSISAGAIASPTNSSHVAPSKNVGVDMHNVPSMMGSFCVLLVGFVCLL